MEWKKVACLNDIPTISGKAISVAGIKIALFRKDEKVYALRDRCPHQSAPLHNGFVKNGVLHCMFHGWTFELEDGAYTFNPDQQLKTYPTKIEGQEVFVGIEAT